MTHNRWTCLLVLVVLPCSTLAAAASSADDRRAEIASQRAAINQRFVEQEAACRQRFVVTSCVNDAREQRRAALVPLREEELRIDTEERKQRAGARLDEIEAKQKAELARDAASAPQAPRPEPTPQEAPRPAGRIGGSGPSKPAVSADERARREAEAEAKFEQRRQEAARHREAVEARNAERAAKGKVAKPLPAVPGASAP